MICDNCKVNNASLMYKQIIDGEELEYNLCNVCAKKLDDELLFLEIFKEFFADFGNGGLSNNRTNIKCNKCGNTLENIKNSGKMGCENCYKLFKNNILPIIKNIQFDNKHTGKATKNLEDEIKLKNELNTLKQKLKEAVVNEDYELAITLRDKIKEIEKGD